MSVRYLYRRSRRHHDRTARLASPSCPRLVQTAMWRFRLRLPNAEHEAHPWVIAQVAPDFKLLDVWGLPAEGGPDEFGSLLEGMASLDLANAESSVSRALWSLRYRLGAWFGWDDADGKPPIPGCTERTLSARLPDDLRGSATGLEVGSTKLDRLVRFTPLYRT